MPGALLAIRVVLVLVLGVAGVAKLADLAGTRAALTGFGVPEAVAAPLSPLVPIAELVAATLLVVQSTASVGAALALALLVLFTAAIARSVVRGETPDCHCFGQLRSAPAGPKTLLRNLILSAGAATLVAGGPGSSATRWVTHLSAAGWIALLAGAALAVLLVGGGAFVLRLLKRHGEMLLRTEALEAALRERGLPLPEQAEDPAEGLPVGDPAPEFELRDLRGGRVTLRSLSAPGRPVMLVFTDPACGPCSALLPTVGAWQRAHGDQLTIAVVSRGDRQANLAQAREHGLADVLLQQAHEVDDRYRVSATPSAVLIGADRTVASRVHAGEDHIAALLGSVTPTPLEIHRHDPTIGSLAPDPELRTLEGEPTLLSAALAELGTTLVLFWNPACGFCERMLDELKRIDTAPPGPTRLLLISTGDPETNRAMRLRAPILLDDSFLAGNAFGAAGTPSAVLVDDRQRVASSIAVGADAVLELARAEDSVSLAA